MPRIPAPAGAVAAALAGLASLALAQQPASAVTERAFQARTTAQLVELCATPPTDPAYQQARQFCHGFAVGALSYRRAVQRPGTPARYCNLPPSRQEAVERFVAWARANPGVMDENPANALFRFLDANYRCAPARRRG